MTQEHVKHHRNTYCSHQQSGSKILVTFWRLTGSLNVESMISFVGTIFHFGMIFSIIVRKETTRGCGFTFSDICNHAMTQTVQIWPPFEQPSSKFRFLGIEPKDRQTLHIGATRTAPSQNAGSFLCNSSTTAPPMDSPYRNRLLFL